MSYLDPMIRITRDSQVRSDQGERTAEVLFDTGAEDTFVRSDVAQSIGNVLTLPEPVDMVLADGKPSGQVTRGMILFIMVEGVWIKTDAYVVDDLAYPIVLGCYTMERYDIRPIPRNGSVTIPKPTTRTHLI